MLLRRSILVALMVSLLLGGDGFAASHHASLQPQLYLPQVHVSMSCETTVPPERVLQLPAQPLAYLSFGDIWLFQASTGSKQRLTQQGNVESFSWSPDATRIVFSTSYSEFKIVRVADQHVSHLYTWPDGPKISHPTWSPDGKHIAFDIFFDDGQAIFSAIMVMRANGTEVKQLSFVNDDYGPAWSPDGRQIAFVSHDRALDKRTLYVMQADGSNPTPLTDGLSFASPVTWSPDGKLLAFEGFCTEGQRRGNRIEFFVIAPDGSGKRTLAAPWGLYDQKWIGRWSPDGRLIIYTKRNFKSNDITVVTVDGSGYQNILLPISIPPQVGVDQPTWAPR
jgi:Tol biopolymer transport system component